MLYLYTAILLIGGNEMGPATDNEMIFSTYLLVFALCFNAWLFGEMAFLVDQFNQKSASMEEEINLINGTCSDRNLTDQARVALIN